MYPCTFCANSKGCEQQAEIMRQLFFSYATRTPGVECADYREREVYWRGAA